MVLLFRNCHPTPHRQKARGRKAASTPQVCVRGTQAVGTQCPLSYQLSSQVASRSRAADTAASTVVCRLKRIDAYKKVDAVILQVVTARDEISIKSVSPINLGENTSSGLENQTHT